MAKFETNKPIITREPSIVVDAGLPPGEYTVELLRNGEPAHAISIGVD